MPMSKKMAETDDTTDMTDTPATGDTTVTTFQLSATNESSLSGSRYFNVFPPILKNISSKSQVRTALVSDSTSQTAPATTLMWKGGDGALALFALTEGITLEGAERVPVTLGSTVAVDWVGKGFTLTPASGGPANAIALTFSSSIPTDTQIGLVAGPAPILVAVPPSLSPMTLEPDLSATVTVVFGTAFQLPEPVVSDWSKEQVVTLKQIASDTGPMAAAQIKVGLDNRIIEIG